MKCPNCDAEMPEGLHFCQQCGVPLPIAAPEVAPVPARRVCPLLWIVPLAAVGLLLLAAILFLFLPRRPALTEVTLSTDRKAAEPQEAPEFPPEGPVYVLLHHQGLRRGDRVTVRWYYEGCSRDQLLEEHTWEPSASRPGPFSRKTYIPLTASPHQPLAIGPYRVEVHFIPHQSTDEQAPRILSFQVVPPPPAIPAQVHRASLAWLVDADDQPLRETTTFTPYDVVYLSLQADLGIYSQLGVQWYHKDAPLPATSETFTTTNNLRDQTMIAFLASPFPLTQGPYGVKICLDGKVERSLEFEVQEEISRPGSFYDDFSEEGWSTEATDTVRRTYQDGKYAIEVLEPDWIGWSAIDETFDDVAVSVTTEQAGGPDDNDYGIIGRLVDDLHFYTFDISGDGYYSIWKFQDEEWITLVKWTPSSAIRQGNAVNRITVLCQGDELSLRVNGVLLARIQDDTFKQGDVAIFSGSTSEGGVLILFDDLEVVPLK